MHAHPTLEFSEVGLNAGLASFTLGLAPGELALFEVAEAAAARWMGDLALGLARPARGEVSFRGTAWRQMSAAEAERNRRRIGRVYVPEEGAVFLQNLDLDENIQLAQRCDFRQRPGEVAERALQVARRLGLEELPKMRPVLAKRRTLQVAQWVRAFLPKDLDLLILDAPLRGAAEEDATLLLRNVAEVRERGTAVLWVDKEGALSGEHRLEATWHFSPVPVALRQEA